MLLRILLDQWFELLGIRVQCLVLRLDQVADFYALLLNAGTVMSRFKGVLNVFVCPNVDLQIKSLVKSPWGRRWNDFATFLHLLGHLPRGFH